MAGNGKAKPTALKILEGKLGHRPLPKNEPKPKVGAPSAPDWLDKAARAEWERIVPELDAIGLLTKVDGFVLGAYCSRLSAWIALEKKIAKRGAVYKITSTMGNSYYKARPEVAIAKEYLRDVRILAAELGLTPSARASMHSSKDSDDGSDLD